MPQMTTSWWRSIVVRPPVLAGEFYLSCARLTAGRVTTLWVKRPLSVNQHSQLSQPSLRGRLNEYSNPCIIALRHCASAIHAEHIPTLARKHNQTHTRFGTSVKMWYIVELGLLKICHRVRMRLSAVMSQFMFIVRVTMTRNNVLDH